MRGNRLLHDRQASPPSGAESKACERQVGHARRDRPSRVASITPQSHFNWCRGHQFPDPLHTPFVEPGEDEIPESDERNDTFSPIP